MLDSLLRSYKRQRQPIRVSFRKLLSDVSYGDRLNHFVHPYAAKLIPHIPLLFLRSEKLTVPYETILDPFCGSGTVPLEAVLANRNAMYCDANPLARLVTKVKTTPISPTRIAAATALVRQAIPRRAQRKPPAVINLDYWFAPHVIRDLQRLVEAIELIGSTNERDFMRVCFSVCVRKASYCDPRLSVPVRLRGDQYPAGHPLRKKCLDRLKNLEDLDVISLFFDIVDANARRMFSFREALEPGGKAICIGTDARELTDPKLGRTNRSVINPVVKLVITSPPYMGAQKYIRASSLSLGWLGLAPANKLRDLESLSIGREHFRAEECKDIQITGVRDADRTIAKAKKINKVRAKIAAQYIDDMQKVFASLAPLISSDGNLVLIAGDNQLCGLRFETARYLEAIILELGFRKRLELVDSIHSRGLMTKRNHTAGIISEERVLMFARA